MALPRLLTRLSAAAAAAAILALASVAPAGAADEVAFGDADLATCVRTELQLEADAPITVDDMAGLVALTCNGVVLTSLTGLEAATQLTSLALTEGWFSVPFEGSVAATQARRDAFFIPLAGLSALREIDFSRQSGMDQSGNDRLALTPITSLPSLRSLTIRFQHVDAAGLAQATQLTSLSVFTVFSTNDLSFLSGLTGLTSLTLNLGYQASVAPLAGLTDLRTLALSGTALKDWDALATLTELRDVDVTGTGVASLEWLTDARALTRLQASFLPELDLDPIADKPLEFLGLSMTPVTSVAPIATMRSLTLLDLSYVGISDVSFLVDLPRLETLYLIGNAVADVTPLAALPSLRTLDISNNRVSDLSPLGVGSPRPSVTAKGQRIDVPAIDICVAHVAPLPTAQDGTATVLKRPVNLYDGAFRDGIVTWIKPDRANALDFTDASGSFTGTVTEPTLAGTYGSCVFDRAPQPIVTGGRIAGDTLGVDIGEWDPYPSGWVEYRWYREGESYPVGYEDTYVTGAADIGREVWAEIRGNRPGFELRVVASTRTLVTARLDGTATISGTPTVGKTLTAVSDWSPDPDRLRYQWYREGTAIKGATAAAYTPVTADLDRAITVRVTATRAGYLSAKRTSPPVTVGRKLTTGTPAIIGTVKVGQTLKGTTGTWGPGTVSLTRSWWVGGSNVAKGSSYTVKPTDAFSTLRLRVVGSKPGYTTASRWTPEVTVQGLKYSSCTALRRDYPEGVAYSTSTKDMRDGVLVKRPTSSTFTSMPMYKLNATLDKDKDGWICE